MVDTGTVIAIVVPNAVAATAIVVGWRQQIRTLDAGRRLTDLANVRTILDDAAVALHRAAYALDDARSHLMQYGHGFFRDAEREKPYHALWKVGQDLDVLLERLAIRFGRNNDIAQAFRGADEALLTFYRKLGLLRLEADAETEDAKRQLTTFLEETRRDTVELRGTFDAERCSFTDAAQRAAGAHLPG